MKKTILFAMMAAVLGFTACSKEEPAQPETIRKGMVLHATVSQSDDTRASFTDNEGVWHFDYAEGDQITVTNNKISTYYTFTYNGTDFISTDAEPTSKPARWYAYYPSKDVSFVGQTGKWEDLANVYALVGSTTYDKDVTGEDGLDITMDPKCAVLKIINQKGSIDINVKHKDNGYWIKGLKDSQASFVPTLGETKQTFLSTTEAGTYYVAVPAGTPLTVYDGDKVIRSTSKGLTAGMYYEITVIPAGALPGKFSVNADKQVYFSQGNLYWDGINNSMEFETNQYDFWDDYSSFAHVSHFYWCADEGSCRFEQYYDPIPHSHYSFFTNFSPEIAHSNFRVCGVIGKYRTPSKDEWDYLINDDRMINGKPCYSDAMDGVSIGGSTYKGAFLYPDDYNGDTVSSLMTWDQINAAGIVFLPAAGYRDGNRICDIGLQGYYWSSSPRDDDCAFSLLFNSRIISLGYASHRYFGYSVRLVTDVK